MQTTETIKQSWDFPVTLDDVFTKSGLKVPNTKAVIRTDTQQALAAVGEHYRLYTHREVEDALNPLVRALGMPVTNYYPERSGARLISQHTFKNVTFNLPEGHKIDGNRIGDVVALRVNIVNSYNSTTALRINLGGMVLRCLNGMTVMNEMFNLSYRHLGQDWKVNLPHPDLIMTSFQKAGETWKSWAYMPIKEEKRIEIVKDAQDMQILPKRYYDLHKDKFVKSDTFWDLYNAFTYVHTHASSRMQESGRIMRLDRLNNLFSHAVKEQEQEQAEV